MAWEFSSACHALDCFWMDTKQLGGLLTSERALYLGNFESLRHIAHWKLTDVSCAMPSLIGFHKPRIRSCVRPGSFPNLWANVKISRPTNACVAAAPLKRSVQHKSPHYANGQQAGESAQRKIACRPTTQRSATEARSARIASRLEIGGAGARESLLYAQVIEPGEWANWDRGFVFLDLSEKLNQRVTANTGTPGFQLPGRPHRRTETQGTRSDATTGG